MGERAELIAARKWMREAKREAKRLLAMFEAARESQRTSCELLTEAYHCLNRQGWEDGPTAGEVQGWINDHLANLGWPGTPGTGLGGGAP